jgi:regulatory protein
MDEAFESAARALRHRDRTVAQLERHLAERGFAESERESALEALTRTGIVDDTRYAENRALVLAGREAGDALIRHDLADAGVSEADAARALEALDPELERALRVVAQRGASARTARFLARKGFCEETIGVVVAPAGRDALG